jgi:murein DD-endopeptidase MepM/ murein hydrolase activator NlpD
VTAAGDGVVGHVGFSRTGGGHVVGIDHGAVWTFYYHGAHATKLRKGQRVEAGECDLYVWEYWGKHWCSSPF